MSVLPVAPADKSEIAAVPESVPPQPARRGTHSATGGGAGSRPMPAASPPELHPPKHDPFDLGLFESARMDREMAREMGQNSQRRNKESVIGAALANMSTPRLLMLVTGVLLLVGGLVALRFPVFLSDFDQWGFQINCGSGFQSDVTQAGVADSAGTHFVEQCHAAIATRRAWIIPVVLAGAVLLSALVLRPSRQYAANAEVSREASSVRSRTLPDHNRKSEIGCEPAVRVIHTTTSDLRLSPVIADR
jgi:hypothetical protein